MPGTIATHHLRDRSRLTTRVELIRERAATAKTAVHRHDFHELLFIATGSGTHMLDMVQHEVKSPSLHLISPRQVHQLLRSADMTGDVVMFAPDALLGQGHGARSELFARLEGPAAISLTNEQLHEARALIGLMESELAKQEPMAEVVEGYLGILLIKCLAWSRDAIDTDAAPGSPSANRSPTTPPRR